MMINSQMKKKKMSSKQTRPKINWNTILTADDTTHCVTLWSTWDRIGQDVAIHHQFCSENGLKLKILYASVSASS